MSIGHITRAMAKRAYRSLTIVASSPRTEIWLGDDAGFLVQMEVGELRTSLLPGFYVVSFGLKAPTYPIDLKKARRRVRVSSRPDQRAHGQYPNFCLKGLSSHTDDDACDGDRCSRPLADAPSSPQNGIKPDHLCETATECRKRIALMRLCSLLLLAMAISLAACQTPAPEVERPPVPIAKPAEGTALMYFFRPELDKVARSDRPTLFLNERKVANLAYASYTFVSLDPGKSRLRMMARPGEAAAWNTELEFEVQAGKTYFVGVWNTNQPGAARMTPIFLPGLVVFVPIGGGVKGEQLVQFEPVPDDVGRRALRGLQHVSAPPEQVRIQ